MVRQRPKALHSLLSRQSLRHFQDFTEQHRHWQQLLATCLSEPQLQHCRVLNVRDGRLVLEVSSAAWATRIKLQQTRIITHFRRDAMASVTSVEIKVNPDAQARTQLAPKVAPQASNAEVLRAQAEQCDEPLRTQLLQLAATFEAAPDK